MDDDDILVGKGKRDHACERLFFLSIRQIPRMDAHGYHFGTARIPYRTMSHGHIITEKNPQIRNKCSFRKRNMILFD